MHFRYYVTDMLKCIAESNGVQVTSRYYDIINIKKSDNRTGDEIALDIIKRAGLKIKEDGNESI